MPRPNLTSDPAVAQRPGYLARILAAVRGLRPGVRHVTVRHDDWCLIWDCGVCVCDPDIEVGPDQARGDS